MFDNFPQKGVHGILRWSAMLKAYSRETPATSSSTTHSGPNGTQRNKCSRQRHASQQDHENPKCQSSEGAHTRYVSTMKYCSSLKSNKVTVFSVTQPDLQSTLSEISQHPKPRVIPFKGNVQNRLIHYIESRLASAELSRGWEWAGNRSDC